MPDPSTIACATIAILAWYAGQTLLRGAGTPARRALARMFYLFAAYAATLVVRYVIAFDDAAPLVERVAIASALERIAEARV